MGPLLGALGRDTLLAILVGGLATEGRRLPRCSTPSLRMRVLLLALHGVCFRARHLLLPVLRSGAAAPRCPGRAVRVLPGS
jgi:hypothetical protein